MARVWLHGRTVTPAGLVEMALTELAGGQITGVWDLGREPGPDAYARARSGGRLPEGDGCVDDADGPVQYIAAGAGAICPGFIDLHVHGGDGADFMDATPEAVERIARFHARHGTTALLATTLTAPPADLLAAIAAARASAAWAAAGRAGAGEGLAGPGEGLAGPGEGFAGATVLGMHMEGPFISPDYPGAQDPRHIRLPDLAEAAAWLDAGDDPVRLVTLAPERPGAPDLARALAGRGVQVNAGHTAATCGQLAEATAAGVSGATHLFNAMTGLHHRTPGVAAGALTLPGVACELIADGIHVHPAMLRLAVAARGADGIILITDAMRAAGLPDGEYRLGDLPVRLAGGAARLAGGPAAGALAGSLLTMDRAVANMVRLAGVPLAEAVAMASGNPARRMGLGGRKGALAPGYDADVAVLDGDLACRLTLVGGRVVYRRP